MAQKKTAKPKKPEVTFTISEIITMVDFIFVQSGLNEMGRFQALLGFMSRLKQGTYDNE